MSLDNISVTGNCKVVGLLNFLILFEMSSVDYIVIHSNCFFSYFCRVFVEVLQLPCEMGLVFQAEFKNCLPNQK